MRLIGKIDPKLYLGLGAELTTDEVIITEERMLHIQERHPEDLERYSGYLEEIVCRPDYVLRDRRPFTAIVLKQISESGERFRLALRLATVQDSPGNKNSILTFLHIREKEWNRLIRNKEILYKPASS